jgi:hypothetical protein
MKRNCKKLFAEEKPCEQEENSKHGRKKLCASAG